MIQRPPARRIRSGSCPNTLPASRTPLDQVPTGFRRSGEGLVDVGARHSHKEQYNHDAKHGLLARPSTLYGECLAPTLHTPSTSPAPRPNPSSAIGLLRMNSEPDNSSRLRADFRRSRASREFIRQLPRTPSTPLAPLPNPVSAIW